MVVSRRKKFEERKPIVPIAHPTPCLSLVHPDQVEAIHRASLEVLETVGMKFSLKEAREILAEAGCRVEGETVFFPPLLVEECLTRVPASMKLCGRLQEDDLVVDGTRSFMNLDGNGMEVFDLESGQRRPTTLRDLEMATRVADYLEQIGYMWQIATARDCPEKVQSLYETRAQLSNTTKHVMAMTVADGYCARGIIEMASAVAGGYEALKARPIVSTFSSVTSPLAFERGATESLLEFARAGLPSGIMTMPLSGATAPVTVAGNLVLLNAEVLGGITLVQCASPGCPQFYATCSTLMDMRSGGVTSDGPEDYLIQAGAIALARGRYNIPVMTGIMGSEARKPGWQSGVEDALSLYTSVLCGADLMPGAGLLKNATVLNYLELMMACEIYEMVRRTVAGFPTDPESLAIEVIRRVGPRGEFMTDPHTLAHMHELWQPQVLRRCSFETWEATGRADAEERALEKVQWILENHVPIPLEESVSTELDRILDRYEKNALS